MVKFVNCLRGGYAKDEAGNPVLFDGMQVRELFEIPEGMDTKSFFRSLPLEKQQEIIRYADQTTMAALSDGTGCNDSPDSPDGLGVIPVAHPVGTETLD